jgi:hypothetical protein
MNAKWRHWFAVPALLLCLCAAEPLIAQTQLPGANKRILEFTANNWVGFRDYNGRQLIYFTHLTAYRCGIAHVAYSLNKDTLDLSFALPPCEKRSANAIPPDFQPYLSLPLNTAHEIYLQLTFKDGTKSQVVRKTP